MVSWSTGQCNNRDGAGSLVVTSFGYWIDFLKTKLCSQQAGLFVSGIRIDTAWTRTSGADLLVIVRLQDTTSTELHQCNMKALIRAPLNYGIVFLVNTGQSIGKKIMKSDQLNKKVLGKTKAWRCLLRKLQFFLGTTAPTKSQLIFKSVSEVSCTNFWFDECFMTFINKQPVPTNRDFLVDS